MKRAERKSKTKIALRGEKNDGQLTVNVCYNCMQATIGKRRTICLSRGLFDAMHRQGEYLPAKNLLEHHFWHEMCSKCVDKFRLFG